MSDRAVFDCMVFLQAVLNENGPAFGCIRLVDDGQVAICISEAVIAEVIDVLSRPELQAKFPRLTLERVETFIRRVHAKAIAISHVPPVFRIPAIRMTRSM